MSIETAVILDAEGHALHWHLKPDRSAGFIPDSTDLWDAIWRHRSSLTAIAHSHPGGGLPRPSGTDLTTFDAIERGLGRPLLWWIISCDGVSAIQRVPETERFVVMGLKSVEHNSLPWLQELHRLSYQ